MRSSNRWLLIFGLAFFLQVAMVSRSAHAEGSWEITPESERALQNGLKWLEQNQGREGNWTSNDLGLVSMGALAFLADGHTPGRGPYGRAAQRALDYVLTEGQRNRSGLLNTAEAQRDMYNHGLSTFVLGQAYGMTGENRSRMGPILDRALKLIALTQCRDGGWDYHAKAAERGHDLSLAVMQAKALRSAVDSGLEVPPEVIDAAIRDVREHYMPNGCAKSADDTEQQKFPGRFTYDKNGGNATVAMAAAGVVCLQEFAQYDDWRIDKSLAFVEEQIRHEISDPHAKRDRFAFDAYTTYYVGQALYQKGGKSWEQSYPIIRDGLVSCQVHDPNKEREGMWEAGDRVGGKPGQLYMTAVACFVLALPNRYLPILQEGKIDSLRQKFQKKNP